MAIRSYQHEEDKKRKDQLFREIKTNLPEGFLQRRIVCTNYKVLKNMFVQRKRHRLQEWHTFIQQVEEQVEHPEFLTYVLT
jgi:hypothetical protein